MFASSCAAPSASDAGRATTYLAVLKSLVGARFTEHTLCPSRALVTDVYADGAADWKGVTVAYKMSVVLPIIGAELSKYSYWVSLETAGDAADLYRRIKGEWSADIPRLELSKRYRDYLEKRTGTYGR